MLIKVIEVIVDGETHYLTGRPSAFCDCLTKNPLEAKNYLINNDVNPFSRREAPAYDPSEEIARDLEGIRLPNDAYYAKSGMAAEAVYAVEFEIEVKEVDRKIGRLPHSASGV